MEVQITLPCVYCVDCRSARFVNWKLNDVLCLEMFIGNVGFDNPCTSDVSKVRDEILSTEDGFIFVGTNFHGLNKNDIFVGFKIRGHRAFFHNSNRKLQFRRFWNLWIGSSTKTGKLVHHEI